MTFRLKALVHGPAGAGKSWLGASTPGPRLILDAEGGSHFAHQVQADGTEILPPRREWNPLTEAPPSGLDPNESVFVQVSTIDDVVRAYEWLASGQHEFNSVVFDSLTDIQLAMRYRLRDEQTKQTDVADERTWGILLDSMVELVREFRDLTRHPTRPLWSVLIIAGSEQKQGVWVPQVQGGLRDRLAGYFDLVMFMENQQDVISGETTRSVQIVQKPHIVAKDRTHILTRKFGETIANPSISAMLLVLNERES